MLKVSYDQAEVKAVVLYRVTSKTLLTNVSPLLLQLRCLAFAIRSFHRTSNASITRFQSYKFGASLTQKHCVPEDSDGQAWHRRKSPPMITAHCWPSDHREQEKATEADLCRHQAPREHPPTSPAPVIQFSISLPCSLQWDTGMLCAPVHMLFFYSCRVNKEELV